MYGLEGDTEAEGNNNINEQRIVCDWPRERERGVETSRDESVDE